MNKALSFAYVAAIAIVGTVTIAAAEDHPRVGPEEHGEYKVFRFPSDLRAGDCHMEGATLTVHRGGRAEFSSVVWTHTNGSDQWHSTIFLEGPGGRKGIGHGDSPSMPHNENGPEHKREFRFSFDFNGAEFEHITQAWEHGDC